MAKADLSKYEMYALSAMSDEVSMIASGLFITIVTGFLVMSYVAGSNLSRRQFWMVTPLFVGFALLFLMNAVGYSAASSYFLPENYLRADRPDYSIMRWQDPFTVANFAFLIGILIIAGSIAFLHDVRRDPAAKETPPDLKGKKTAKARKASKTAKSAKAASGR